MPGIPPRNLSRLTTFHLPITKESSKNKQLVPTRPTSIFFYSSEVPYQSIPFPTNPVMSLPNKNWFPSPTSKMHLCVTHEAAIFVSQPEFLKIFVLGNLHLCCCCPPTGSTGKVYTVTTTQLEKIPAKKMKISWIQNGDTMNHHESQLLGRKKLCMNSSSPSPEEGGEHLLQIPRFTTIWTKEISWK